VPPLTISRYFCLIKQGRFGLVPIKWRVLSVKLKSTGGTYESQKSDAFKSEAVQLALTSGLTRKEVSADLGIGFSTLNKWVSQYKHDDLISALHFIIRDADIHA